MLVVPRIRPRLVYGGLVAFELVFCALIIRKIAYTEIDWVTYMRQIELVKNGITDYSKITGPTGLLVYPGGHVAIFSWLYDHFPAVGDAQWVFMGVYLATLAGVLAVYHNAKIPWYYACILVASKRLHSIYLLRLFNDCFSVLFSVYAVLCIQLNLNILASILFSVAISVKMSAILYIPGLAIIWWNQYKFWAAPFALVAAIPQLLFAKPFLGYWKEYLNGAFDLRRQFLYKWTVNWRFVPQKTFNSPAFATSLMATHLSLLVVLAKKTLNKPMTVFKKTQILMVSNLIGILCARSLHYQFYSWFFWTVPLLLTKVPLPLKLAIPLALEYAWLTYPSTNISSGLNLACLSTLLVCNLVKM